MHINISQAKKRKKGIRDRQQATFNFQDFLDKIGKGETEFFP